MSGKAAGRAGAGGGVWRGWTAVLAALVAALVPALPARPTPGGEPAGLFTGRVLVALRSVEVTGSNEQLREDLDVDDGPRLAELDLRLVPAGRLAELVDRVELGIDELGGEPRRALRLTAGRRDRWDFDYRRVESDFFAHDPIPGAALGGGPYTGPDAYTLDIERVTDRARLGLQLSPRAGLDLGYERQTREGVGLIAIGFDDRVAAVDRTVEEGSRTWSAGFHYAWRRATLVIEETIGDHDDATALTAPGRGYDPGAPGLPSDFALDRPYDATERTHAVRLVARPRPRWTLTAAASLARVDLDLEAAETVAGRDPGGDPPATATSGSGAVERDAGRLGVELARRIGDRVRVSAGAYRRRLDQDGTLGFGEAAGRSRWEIDATGTELEVQATLSPALTAAGGVRRERREAVGTEAYPAGPALTEVDLDTRHTGGWLRLGWRPVEALRLTAGFETDAYDDPLSPAAPTDRRRLRLGGHWRFGDGFALSGSAESVHADNAGTGWRGDRDHASLRLGYSRPGIAASVGYVRSSIERSIVAPATMGPDAEPLPAPPVDYRSDADHADARLRWTFGGRWTAGGALRLYDNDGSFALDRDDGSVFVEIELPRGYLLRASWRRVDYDEDGSAIDDYRARIAELAVGYRW
jgi:hypothetical protein